MSKDRPRPSSEVVRKFMSDLRTSNTKPELRLRSVLHARGLRYRLHRKDLPGRPDIVFVGARVVVFVDGCFWHGCPIHRVQPKANAGFWQNKVEENRQRDRRNDRLLQEMGWEVIHVWEHEDVEEAANRIEQCLPGRVKS
jgi:DNA mismatch endonuclease (patch repair protein)